MIVLLGKCNVVCNLTATMIIVNHGCRTLEQIRFDKVVYGAAAIVLDGELKAHIDAVVLPIDRLDLFFRKRGASVSRRPVEGRIL